MVTSPGPRNEADRCELTIGLTEQARRFLLEDIRACRIWLEDAIAAALDASEREFLLAAVGPILKLAFHETPEINE